MASSRPEKLTDRIILFALTQCEDIALDLISDPDWRKEFEEAIGCDTDSAMIVMRGTIARYGDPGAAPKTRECFVEIVRRELRALSPALPTVESVTAQETHSVTRAVTVNR